MNANFLLGCGRNLKNNFLQAHSKLGALRRSIVYAGVDIPPRIERGPVDILKALSNTIKDDSSAPSYKHQIGISTADSYMRRKLDMLAIESGRKTARWIVKKHPEFFQSQIAEPFIQAFAPPKTLTEETEVSEMLLLDFIDGLNVETSITVYNKLKEKGIDVSPDTMQKLLDLVCFYNSTNLPDDTIIEEKMKHTKSQINVNTWQSEFPRSLFFDMEKNLYSYSAMILGMFKYWNLQDAMDLFYEAKNNGIKFPVDVYNAVLENIAHVVYQPDEIKLKIEETLKSMEKEGVKPNLGTLNSTLKCVAKMRTWNYSRKFAMDIYGEFCSLGIKPSLATYYHILDIYFDKVRTNNVFKDILAVIKGKKWTLRDPDDVKFFTKAMEIAFQNYKNFELASEVHNIFCDGNKDLLVYSLDQQIYYRFYLMTAVLDDIRNGMKLYCQLTPYVYFPDFPMMLSIIECVTKEKAYDYIPVIFEHMKLGAFFNWQKIPSAFISLLAMGLSHVPHETAKEIGEELWKIINELKKNTISFDDMSSLIIAFSKSNLKELADQVFDKAEKKYIAIELSYDAGLEYLKLCSQTMDVERAMRCIEYMNNVGEQYLNKLIQYVQDNFNLKDENKTRLESLMQQ